MRSLVDSAAASIFLVVALLSAPGLAWTTLPTSTSLGHRWSVHSKPSSSSSRLHAGFFQDLFNNNKNKKEVKVEPEKIVYDPVTIGPDPRLAGVFLVTGLLLDTIPFIKFTLGPIVTLLGLLFLAQVFFIRFRFTEDNELELVAVSNPFTGETMASTENSVVGGANKWAVDTIVNYDFFPAVDSSPVGPILVYFKETQTDSELWNDGPGKWANDPEKVAKGQVIPGQIHFFPATCNTEQLRNEFVKRNVPKL